MVFHFLDTGHALRSQGERFPLCGRFDHPPKMDDAVCDHHIHEVCAQANVPELRHHVVPNPYLALRDIMPERTLGREYAGGLIGYVGYDAVPYFEPSLTVKQSELFEQFLFGVYTDGVILDKETNELSYFYYDTDRSAVLRELMQSESAPRPLTVTFVRDTLSKEEHARAVEEVKERIRAGDTFQCEVGFRSEYTVQGDTLTVYEKLRTVNPSPFMYYLKFGDTKVIGASPELLFSLRDGEMTTRPLAGTIRRGTDEQEDRQLARTLLNDPKEKAEHNMLVDLHRNDIGKVAEAWNELLSRSALWQVEQA